MTNRHTRYQGAILQDQRILLIKHRFRDTGQGYWVIPGGGRLDGESAEDCVHREMKEETHLDVRIVGLLLDEQASEQDIYKRLMTFQCEPVGGKARPGVEPELEANSVYSISEVKWFRLWDESEWDDDLRRDQITYPILQRIRAAIEQIE